MAISPIAWTMDCFAKTSGHSMETNPGNK